MKVATLFILSVGKNQLQSSWSLGILMAVFSLHQPRGIPPRAESVLNGSSLSSSNGRKIPQFDLHITRNSPADIKVNLYLSHFISRLNIT